MTQKTRLIILLACVMLFLIITPYIVLYSLGYRVDFGKLKIVQTGGIFVKAEPQGVDIIIGSQANTTGLFNNSVFVQNLLPSNHVVTIKKAGYYDYQKNLDVTEGQVTKLEHVILFKKDIVFSAATESTVFPPNRPDANDAYLLKNNNLYPVTKTALPASGAVAIIKNVIAYIATNSTITYLGTDGFLYQYDTATQQTTVLTTQPFAVKKTAAYRITIAPPSIWLLENESLFLLNQDTKTFESFYNPVNEVTISPDGQKNLLCNDHEILYSFASNPQNKIFLNRFSGQITDCQWLTNDYVIFNLGGPPSPEATAGQSTITISEIDTRGDINIVTLPNPLPAGAQLYFNQQDKKLYVLDGNILTVSDKLIP